MRQHRFRPGVFILTAALLLCILSACGSMPPSTDSTTTPPPTPSPSPAAAVVDAASISRPAVDMLDPSKDFDWLQQVAIPRLETGNPSASLDNFNADIWEAYRGPLEKLEAGEEENELYNIYYENDITDSVVGILVYSTIGWQYSETVYSVDGYYYDLESDCPITAAEYVARCGGDWEALQTQAVEGILGIGDYQDSEDVAAGDAVLYNGQGFQVEVSGVYSVSGYPWTVFYWIDA